jgi:hypothetical protein
MVAGNALILFRSALFRDVFAKLFSGWAETVRTHPLMEAAARLADVGQGQELTVLLEVDNGDEQVDELVWSYLSGSASKNLRVYVVDLKRDRMTEYRRQAHRSIDILKQPAGANSN